MRLRVIITNVVLTLFLFGSVACDQGKKEEAEKAAAEAQKQAQAAAEQAKTQAAEAVKKAEEAKAAAEAEAQKAIEAAKAEAEAKLAAEKAKADEATKAAEAAKAEAEAKAAELAKASEVTPEEQERILQLAVDLGCLKKKETDAQKMLETEESLFAGAELDKAAFYTKLETIKGKDAASTTKIDEAVALCPSFEDIQRAKVVGVLVQNKCLRDAKIKPEKMGQIQTEILASFELTAEEYTALRDKFKDEEAFKAAVEEGSKSCPPVAEEDVVTEAEARTKPPAGPELGGDYIGKIFGSANGQITVKTSPKRITGGLAKFVNAAFQLNGQVLSDGRVTIQGRNGADFIRGYGKLDGTRTRMMGNWTGSIGGAQKAGSFMLTKR